MTKRKIQAGPNTMYMVEGIVAFTTTGETVEVDCQGLKHITCIGAIPLAAYGANDQLSINETVADGQITVPAEGTVTLTRNSSGTSALSAAVWMIGF
jgi:hypothetical protein